MQVRILRAIDGIGGVDPNVSIAAGSVEHEDRCLAGKGCARIREGGAQLTLRQVSRVSQASLAEVSILQIDAVEIGSREIGSHAASVGEVGIGEVGVEEDGT